VGHGRGRDSHGCHKLTIVTESSQTHRSLVAQPHPQLHTSLTWGCGCGALVGHRPVPIALTWGCTPSPGVACHQLGWHHCRPSPVRHPCLGPHALIAHCPLLSPRAVHPHLGQHPRRSSPSPGAACHQLGRRCHCPSPIHRHRHRHPSPLPGAARPHLGWHPCCLLFVALAWGCMPSTGAVPSCRLSPAASPSPSSGAARPHLGQCPRCLLPIVLTWGCMPLPGVVPSLFVTLAWGCTPSTGAALSLPVIGPSPSSSVTLAWGCMPSPGVAPLSFVALAWGLHTVNWGGAIVTRCLLPVHRPRLGPHALTWGSAVVTRHLTLPGAAQFHMGWHPCRPSPLPAACRHLAHPLPLSGAAL
jgi:hypothetical protein